MNEDEWVSISEIDKLPKPDVWVQVFEDDNQDNLFLEKRQRVTPAKLLFIDAEGYPEWYLGYVGGSPCRHVRNVTHWRPMSEPPKKNN